MSKKFQVKVLKVRVKVPKVPRFQAKVPCQVSKEFQVKVPSRGSE